MMQIHLSSIISQTRISLRFLSLELVIEPYALLMIHRDEESSANGPLIVALKFDQSLESVDYPDGEEFLLEPNQLTQQLITTKYFERMKKTIKMGKTKPSCLNFDFVYPDYVVQDR